MTRMNINPLLFQYPLKEVVAISNDPQTLKDVKSLESYILEVSTNIFLSKAFVHFKVDHC